MQLPNFSDISLLSVSAFVGVTVVSALCSWVIYNVYFHPLAKYPGPWYAASFSLSLAIISWLRIEPRWMQSQVDYYRLKRPKTPIRIQPRMLLFPQPSALKEIYWDAECNQKSGLYGSGALGPPHLFTTLDANKHRALRKALGGQQWTMGSLRNKWEHRFDELIQLFVGKMVERAEAKEPVVLSNTVAQFAADIMTMISFTTPFGFVRNSRDERGILGSWRQGLDYFGFIGRFAFLRDYLINLPGLSKFLLPTVSDQSGMGWLMCEADKQVTQREIEMERKSYNREPDFLQHCLQARMDGNPLNGVQKRAHVTLLIQAGADTTGTALGSTLRFLIINPEKKKRAQQEIDEADDAGKLSTPVQYEEARVHLPYLVACINEALRLNPPATNLFARIVGKEGKKINGHFIPPGTDITSYAYVVQRDPELYAPDPDKFRPERWLESKEKANEMAAASFAFGMGPRVCLGKDIALMELYKLIPEIVRRFDFNLVDEGEYVVAGGVAYNKNLVVQLEKRHSKTAA